MAIWMLPWRSWIWLERGGAERRQRRDEGGAYGRLICADQAAPLGSAGRPLVNIIVHSIWPRAAPAGRPAGRVYLLALAPNEWRDTRRTNAPNSSPTTNNYLLLRAAQTRHKPSGGHSLWGHFACASGHWGHWRRLIAATGLPNKLAHELFQASSEGRNSALGPARSGPTGFAGWRA